MSLTVTPAATNQEQIKAPLAIELPSTSAPSKEPPKEATPVVPTEPKESASEKFAYLSKREKQLLREKQELKALKNNLLQQQQQFEQREAKLKQFESLQNPLEKMKYLGTDYNELTQYVLNNGAPTPEIQVQAVKKELEEFKRMQEEQIRQQQELQQQAAQRELDEIIVTFKEEIGSYTKGKSEEYELINHFDQSSLVYDTIQEYFNSNKKVLSIKEASDLVEKYLEDQVKKTATTKKFSKLVQPESSAKDQKSSNQQQSQNPQSRTITNNLTPSMPSTLPASTERERMARAMAKLGG